MISVRPSTGMFPSVLATIIVFPVFDGPYVFARSTVIVSRFPFTAITTFFIVVSPYVRLATSHFQRSLVAYESDTRVSGCFGVSYHVYRIPGDSRGALPVGHEVGRYLFAVGFHRPQADAREGLQPGPQ